MTDVSLEHAVGWKPDGVAEALGLQILNNFRRGKGSIASEVAPQLAVVDPVDPGVSQISQSGEIAVTLQPLRLEAAQLAR